MVIAALAVSCALAFADAPASVPGSAAPIDQTLTADDYQKGLQTLSKYLQSRGENQQDIDRFVGDLLKAPPPTRDVLAGFLKYEQAWARKTRDAKNPQVKPDQLAHENQLYAQLKNQFANEAKAQSPDFLNAFHAAVKDVRAGHGAQPGGAPVSSAMFGDQTDDSYTQVDAGDEALDQGDAATAAADAQQAISENPANADAYALQAGADLAQGDPAAAAQAAQTALSLDPSNQTAQAVTDLAGGSVAPAANTVADAGAIGGNLQNQVSGTPSDAAAAPAPVVSGELALSAPSPAPYASLAVPPPAPGTPPPPSSSATPLLAASLASQVAEQAARTMNVDPAAGMRAIAQAISLDPSNPDAWRLQAAALQRAGDYRDALAAANRATYLAPKDARAHYARAEALAFNHQKAEMTDELRQAAALDPTYRPVADSAIQLPQDSDLTLLFPDAREPLSMPHKHRHRKAWRRFWITLGATGGLFLFAGLVYALLADREQRRARPKLQPKADSWA